MMKKLLASAVLGLISTASYATQNYLPLGSNLTWGSTAQFQYLMSHKNNPATGARILEWRTGGYGMGLVGPVGLGIDVGPLGEAVNISNDLSTLIEDFENLSSGSADTINLEAVSDTLTFADQSLDTLGTAIDINISLGFEIPLFPMVITHKKFGSVFLDVNNISKVRARFLDSPLDSNPLVDPFKGITSKYSTNSALYLKVANVTEGAVGYSREVYRDNRGILYAGLKTNIYSVFLQKSLMPLLNMGGAGDEATEQLKSYSDSQQMNAGIDVGAVFVADYYRLGATLRNINAPSFSYNAIGVDCAENETNGAQENCYRAQAFAGEIDLREDFVMYPQINLEAAMYSKSRNWVASVALETNAANDPVGNPHQWATISAGYAAPNQLLPGIRTGYRKNLAGSQLSYLSLGLNWFMIYLDAAVSIDTIDLPETYDIGDGPQEIPSAIRTFGRRSLYLSVGTDFIW